MVEILPTKLLTDEDSVIFGSLSVSLGKLARAGLPTAQSFVITPPHLKLKTILEHYNFGKKEIFEQSITLVKKEIKETPVPEILIKEMGKHKLFLVNGVLTKSVKDLWQLLLNEWLESIKQKLWKDGFYTGVTESLEPQIVVLVKKIQTLGEAFFDPLSDEVLINTKIGKKPHPNDLKKIVEIVKEADKKLYMPHHYQWILDMDVKISKVLPYTPPVLSNIPNMGSLPEVSTYHTPEVGEFAPNIARSAIKVFFDLSSGFAIEKNIDGIYIASEKIFDLNKPSDSFENLTFKIVEAATTFPTSPIFVKLADMSEGMGKVRGALRLVHQDSLLDPITDALSFARHKKGLTNVHIVIPFIRGVQELLQVKRELAIKKLMRKNSLQIWMEVCTPENMVNLEDYLVIGVDGVVLNLDELIAHLNGFDHTQGDLIPYKSEVGGLIKFIEDGLKLLHKSKVPFIVSGSLSMHPQVLEFLIEKGVYGIVVQKYEAHSIKDLLYQVEKRLVLRRS